jgi:uncharacterized protein (DUF1330 family)
MTAYVIARVQVDDAAAFSEYERKAFRTVKPHGGRLLAAGPGTMFEGEPANHHVILEFPSVEAAEAWYRSPEYQETVPIRQRSTSGGLLVLLDAWQRPPRPGQPHVTQRASGAGKFGAMVHPPRLSAGRFPLTATRVPVGLRSTDQLEPGGQRDVSPPRRGIHSFGALGRDGCAPLPRGTGSVIVQVEDGDQQGGRACPRRRRRRRSGANLEPGRADEVSSPFSSAKWTITPVDAWT